MSYVERPPDYIIETLKAANAQRRHSPDTSSQIGVAICSRDGTLLVVDHNRFPDGIDGKCPERMERPTKYKYIEHAERNAIYKAAFFGVSLNNSIMCMVGMGPSTVPCIECARALIQGGVRVLYGLAYKPVAEHWQESLRESSDLLAEAGVQFYECDPQLIGL